MDVAILVSFALRMANHNDHLLAVSHPLLNTALASHLLVVLLIVRMGRECLLPLSHDVP